MNFLCHALLADRVDGPSPERALGAALPDLASIIGVRIDREALPAAVRAGIALHVATDAAFHAEPVFRDGTRQLSAAVARRGLGRGPSRAVGHVGWELLLDGALLADPRTAEVFERALSVGSQVTPALAPEARDRWIQLVDGLATQRWWSDYDDPDVVAVRLQRMLGHRPRLRFPADGVPGVAAALRALQPNVVRTAPAIVSSVTAALTSP